MDYIEQSCISCGVHCDNINRENGVIIYHCKFCGPFTIFSTYEFRPDIKSAIFYFLHNKRKNKETHYIFGYDYNKVTPFLTVYVSESNLLALLPSNFSEQIDYIIVNLSSMTSRTDGKTLFNASVIEYKGTLISNVYGLIQRSLDVDMEKKKWDEYLHQLGYLENDKLSAKAWLRIQELQQNNKIIPQGFIAMSFADEMASAQNAIMAAIKECGYTPMIMNKKEHNNQIVPEILHEIKQSIFVVADITGHRNGVYYESGYAHALEKEVILTCRDSDFKERHFDIAQKNTIVWANEVELRERLTKRIIATVGKAH